MSATGHSPAPALREQLSDQEQAALWAALDELTDPEIPVVTLREMGILRALRRGADGQVEVVITPTYSGCPAMEQIADDIGATLRRLGVAGRVVTQLAPAWTTDWMTEAARESLAQMPDVARIVSDASRCRWRAEELGRVTSALSVHVQDAPIFTAAQAVGDVGAATALLSVVMGLSAGPGGSLILASERSGSRRSAIVIPAARAGASGLSCGGAGLALG